MKPLNPTNMNAKMIEEAKARYNRTTVVFRIADVQHIGMYSSAHFLTLSEAREVREREYTNRSTGNEEYDAYWRGRPQVIIKVTEIVEVIDD